jgi:vitamin-K-epoxide reductase (warfarin-sensitive)
MPELIYSLQPFPPPPGWRNWQTQRTQNPPTFGSWGFDPPSRHQIEPFLTSAPKTYPKSDENNAVESVFAGHDWWRQAKMWGAGRDPSQLRSRMKYTLMVLTLLGIVVSSLALREHYRTDDNSPCSINDRWDCGIVNKSQFAMIRGVPVAVIGIAGYLLLGVLALKGSYKIFLAGALAGLGFSLYLANIEAHILGVWCIYCVISLAVISLLSLLSLGTVIVQLVRRPRPATSD